MKIYKVLSVLAGISILAVMFAGCSDAKSDKTIVVGASPSPQAEILQYVKPQLEAKGYSLKVVTYEDYVQPNKALTDKTLDANYFQHVPYLNNYNKQNGTNIVSAGAIHYEPLGIYPGKSKSLSDLKDGDSIAVPNDTTNEARALLLLQDNNIIKVDSSKGLNITKNDITSNPKNIKLVELDAAQIPRSLNDVNFGVINGNYALSAGLSVKKNALASESANSSAAKTYANIIAVRNGDQNKAAIKALVSVLKSSQTKKWILNKYQGNVVAVN